MRQEDDREEMEIGIDFDLTPENLFPMQLFSFFISLTGFCIAMATRSTGVKK